MLTSLSIDQPVHPSTCIHHRAPWMPAQSLPSSQGFPYPPVVYVAPQSERSVRNSDVPLVISSSGSVSTAGSTQGGALIACSSMADMHGVLPTGFSILAGGIPISSGGTGWRFGGNASSISADNMTTVPAWAAPITNPIGMQRRRFITTPTPPPTQRLHQRS